MLVVHRVDDVGECLISTEQAMPARQDIAFHPSFERVFAEDLHHAAIGSDVGAIGILRLDRGQPGLQTGFIDILEPIGRILVRAEHTEAAHVAPHNVAQKLAQRFRR